MDIPASRLRIADNLSHIVDAVSTTNRPAERSKIDHLTITVKEHVV